jgi:predicted ATPase
MAVRRLFLGNFKGIDAEQWIEFKPLTIFLGANSSGKSSCIHGLACLSQTIRLPNSTRPLILDDEYADVHLGRFIEVVHNKSYKQTIKLGVSADPIGVHGHWIRRALGDDSREASATYEFSSTLRTQEMAMPRLSIGFGDVVYDGSLRGGSYVVTDGATETKFERKSGFLLRQNFAGSRQPPIGELQLSAKIMAAQGVIETALESTFYLGPFRQPPLRRYPTRGASPRGVGPLGEGTATLLANEVIQSQRRPHIDKVAAWLAVLGVAKALEVARVGRSDLFEVNLTLEDDSRFPIADLGYGLSQVLPVLVQCAFAPEHSTLLFEQPELHLHKMAARPLVRVFRETIKEKNATIIIETHSPEIVGQVLQDIRGKRMKKSDVAVYRVSREDGASRVSAIDIDEQGDVYDNWERGISVP